MEKRQKTMEQQSQSRTYAKQIPLDTKVALLGAGKMGGTLVQAFLKYQLFQPQNITATVTNADRAAELAHKWGIRVTTNNLEAARKSDLILLGLKPQTVPEVVAQIRTALTPEKCLISFAASVKIETVERAAGVNVGVIRAMPNTPALLGYGATALCQGKYVSAEQLNLAERVFRSVGRTVIVEEKHMDAVTGLSGSGPAYIYIILEALAEAGVKVGLPRDVATLLAAQTALGAASMVLETGSHPALLKDAVTTPAGCTMDGILELEEGGLRVTLIKAVMRATQRAAELASS